MRDQHRRVLVSAPAEELAEERVALQEAIQRLGFAVADDVAAQGPADVAGARSAAVFVGLYGEHFGSSTVGAGTADPGEAYRRAASLPRLVYVKEPGFDRDPRLTDLIAEMDQFADLPPRRFFSSQELVDLVTADLAPLAAEIGPVSAQPEGGVRPDEAETAQELPLPPTSFVGRDREVRDLAALLIRDDIRLVTLAGMGGIGKTRLALEVGRTLGPWFPGGVHLVHLAAIPQAELVIPTIASSLGIRADDPATAPQDLGRALSGRRMLLILDNFEQVVDAAPALATLLESTPDLTVLVTSRRLLRLAAEHEYDLATLSLPEQDAAARPEEIAQADAVRLFVDRATSVRPDFSLTEGDAAAVAEICRRLEGVPLAIELAAARVRLLSPAALLARLDGAMDVLRGGLIDLPERQRSLRATLDWSHSLLGASAQRLFARLSAFAGGWTLEAAERVCAGTPEERDHVLDGLAELVDSSLVVLHLEPGMAEGRFRMLEPVREYARERLAGMAENEEIEARHIAYYEQLTIDASAALRGRNQQEWLDRLEVETGNLAAAAERSLARGEITRLVDVAWNIWVWIWLNNHVTEARHWLEPVQAVDATLPAVQRARLHWVLGCLLFEQGHFEPAGPLLHASLDEFTQLGDDEGRALAFLLTGALLPFEGEDEKSAAYTAQAIDLLRQQGDRFDMALACGSLGMHWVRRGEVSRGEELIQSALHEAATIDNKPMIGQIRLYQSFVAAATGRIDEAHELLEELVESAGHRRSDEVLAYGFEGLAGVALAGGDPARAATLLGAAAGLRQRTGMTVWPDMRPLIDALIAGTQASLKPEEYEIAWAAGHALTRAAARAFALGEAAAARDGSQHRT